MAAISAAAARNTAAPGQLNPTLTGRSTAPSLAARPPVVASSQTASASNAKARATSPTVNQP